MTKPRKPKLDLELTDKEKEFLREALGDKLINLVESHRRRTNWYGILDDDHNVVLVEPHKWAIWFEENLNTDKRIVAQEDVQGFLVSTVFLGINHAFPIGDDDRKELWFETMVFRSGMGKFNAQEYECARYETWEQAVAGHRAMVELVREGAVGE